MTDKNNCYDLFQKAKVNGKRIYEEKSAYKALRYKFEIGQEPDMSIFTEQEMETINHVFNLCKDDGGRKLYELSHEEEGYLKTPACQPISYGKHASELKI